MSSRGTTSVVIPVCNCEKYIGPALESVRAQTRRVEEVIVVDDGSTDSTADVVESFPEVILLRQANQGPSAARNLGIAHASGDYLAMLDGDDIWPSDRQEILAGRLDEDPAVDLVIGTQRLLVEEGAELPHWVPPGDLESIDQDLLPRGLGVFVARRSAFEAVGAYDETMLHAEDTDWLLRSQDLGVPWAVISDVVLVRRIHGANLTYDAEAQRRAMFDVLQKRMARRRVDE